MKLLETYWTPSKARIVIKATYPIRRNWCLGNVGLFCWGRTKWVGYKRVVKCN